MLPPEIRVGIWHSYLQSYRIVGIDLHAEPDVGPDDGDSASQLLEAPPLYSERNKLGNVVSGQNYRLVLGPQHQLNPLLRVSAEARAVALGFYRLKIPCSSRRRPAHDGHDHDRQVYISPEFDFVHVQLGPGADSVVTVYVLRLLGNGDASRFQLPHDPRLVAPQALDAFTSTLINLQTLYFYIRADTARTMTSELIADRIRYNRGVPIEARCYEDVVILGNDPRRIEHDLRLVCVGDDPRASLWVWQEMVRAFGIAGAATADVRFLLTSTIPSTAGGRAIRSYGDVKTYVQAEERHWQALFNETTGLFRGMVNPDTPEQVADAVYAVGFWLVDADAFGAMPERVGVFGRGFRTAIMAAEISFTTFYNVVGSEKRGVGESKLNGINPSNGKPLWDVPVATPVDLEDAVSAAKTAFPEWSARLHDERSKLVKEFSDALEKYKTEFTELLHHETGKPTAFAESEVVMGINTTRGNSNWSVPDQVLKDDETVRIVKQHAPIGVVAGITPWNYPFQMAILKIAPALMAGCTVILKPSPYTPYCALKIGEVANSVFPAGVVQVLSGDDNLGPWITQHPGISKISFTGSTATGKKVMASASATLKRVNLELGGNDAAVITQDFDIAEAARMVATATFAHSGQICMATKRIYVHDSVYDEFLQHLIDIVKTYTPGEGFCSPIQNQMQYDKVRALYEDCADHGYDFAVGSGDVPEYQPGLGAGYFVKPAVIANPPDTSRIVQEEPFGPIVPVLKWNSDEELVRRVNDTPTGLGATVYCRGQTRAWALASRLETGSVWVNGGLKLHPEALFGAHKQSGIGGELGPLGLTYYTNSRTVTYWKDDKTTVPKGDGGLFA
ncbi:hypothetical protein SEUCBS140593_000847 [Sporothrix eucalyptigena]|uniref:aldehyde dehydrogenase (NAD(+)) n=1 Tax=Sporothrix eucalyptigena TaxID=1812306 RepID=A0ABP0ATC9_9PEZI